MDVISMKKTISMLILCLLIVATLCSCGEQPLTMETESVKKIALTSNVGGNITLEKEEDVTAILLALQNASCVTCSTKQEALPQEQFRFTAYNANDEVMHTMVLYSNEYLQLYVFPGNFPFFLIKTSGKPNFSAKGAANKKPRDSIPAIPSIFFSLQSAATVAAKSEALQ